MADEVLKNWVALLEFKVDAGQARDLLLKVNSVSTAILGIAAAIEAASLAFKGLLLKSSEAVESTSFVAERAGGSVKDLTALREAAEATGNTFADADASIEGFSKQWRNGSIQNTVRETLRQAGMAKKEIDELFAAGNLFPIIQKTIEAINAKKNPAAEDAYRRLFGINENLGRWNYPEFERVIRRTAERWDKAGINVGKLTENSRKLQGSWRELWSAVDTIVKSVTEKLSPYLTEQIEKIVKLLDENGKDIQKWITETVTQLGEFIKSMRGQAKPALDAMHNVMTPIIASLRWLVNTFAQLTGQTNKWQAAIELLLGVFILRMLRARGIVTSIIALLARHPVIAGMLALGLSSLYATQEHPEIAGSGAGGVGPLPEVPEGPSVGAGPGLGILQAPGRALKKGWDWLTGKKTTDATGGPVSGSGGPGHVGGQLDIEGEHYRFGSGGHGNAPIPPGDYPITPNTIGPWGRAHGALGINNNAIWDSSLGRMRRGIELHAGSSDQLITEGCVAIAGAQWPQFKEHVKRMIAAHGRAFLHVGKDGAARVDISPSAAGASARRDPKFAPYTPRPESQEGAPHTAASPGARATPGASPFGNLNAEEIRERFRRPGPAGTFHQSSNRYSFGQEVAVNIHGSDNDPATKVGSMAGPMHDARLLRNTKGAVA